MDSVKSGGARTDGWGIIVHGGAGALLRGGHEGHREGCLLAAQSAAQMLCEGARALDAVQRAVESLEDDPRFNAGTGASLTIEGRVELDASIMDGDTLRVGAVCALPPFQHPIAIARAVLEQGRHVFYAGSGAARFAETAGFEPVPEERLVTETARHRLTQALGASSEESGGGTVGAVALDAYGAIAAATSTGGTVAKLPGRVGDSPVPGAGTYADSRAGGASATGHGEGILRVALTSSLVSRLRSGESAEAASRIVLDDMAARVRAEAGVITIDRRGHLAWAHTSPALWWAWVTPGGEGACADR